MSKRFLSYSRTTKMKTRQAFSFIRIFAMHLGPKLAMACRYRLSAGISAQLLKRSVPNFSHLHCYRNVFLAILLIFVLNSVTFVINQMSGCINSFRTGGDFLQIYLRKIQISEP